MVSSAERVLTVRSLVIIITHYDIVCVYYKIFYWISFSLLVEVERNYSVPALPLAELGRVTLFHG